MDLALKLPLDYRERRWFSLLCQEVGGAPPATFIFVNLWRQLGYLALEPGNSPGRLTPADSLLFLDELKRAGVASADGILFKLADPVKLLSPIPSGESGWLCPLFISLNGGMGNSQRSREQRGGDLRSFGANARAASAEAFSGGLFLDPKILVAPDGQPLSADEVRRVRYLVNLCDGALFRGARPEYSWGTALVQNALAVVRAYTDDQCFAICRKLASRRGHPSLTGVTTETLLPNWQNLAAELEG